MQKRILKSKIKVTTSAAKPNAKKYVIVDVIRNVVQEGIKATISVHAIYDDAQGNYSTPSIAYEVPAPGIMGKVIPNDQITVLEALVQGDIPTEITSVNERLKYFDLLAAIHIMVTDDGGAMFGLDTDDWEIIEVNN